MAAFVDDEFTATASTTTVTITKPTGISVGDYLIAVIRLVTGSENIDPPDGWYTLLARRRTGGNPRLAVFYKKVTTTETAASNFAFSQTGASAAMEGYMVALTDVSAVHPVVTSNDSLSSTASVSSVTAQANDAFLTFVLGTASAQTGDTTAPISLTERRESDDFLYVAADQIASGATGTLSSTIGAGSMDHVVAAILFEDGAYVVDNPTVDNIITETGLSLGASNTQTLPAGSASGDLVVAVVANDNTGATNLSASTGWASATQVGTTGMKTQIFARVLTGTTGDNILSVTGASQDYVCTMCRIVSGTHGVTDAATWLAGSVSATATGTNSTPDPPSVTPGTNQAFLWLVAIANDQTGSSSRINGFPAGYVQLDNRRSAGSTSSVALSVSMRQATGTSENPGIGSVTGVNEWHAWTLAVPPATSPDATATPGVVTASASVPAPAATGGVNATPATATAQASVPAPSVAAGGATVNAPVVTALASVPAPLVFQTSTAVTDRSWVYLPDFIAALAEAPEGVPKRVIMKSEQTGELTTLGKDELEGWVDPVFPEPPDVGWPPGSWGGGGPSWPPDPNEPLPPGFPPDTPPPPPPEPFDPPDPPYTPPDTGSPVPEIPPWEEPPPGGDGEVAPDPGYPGALQDTNGAYIAWDARHRLADADVLPLSGLATIPLRTEFYAMDPPNVPVYWDDAGELWWSFGEFAPSLRMVQTGRQWSSGVLGGLPYTRAITFVFTLRPAYRPNGFDQTAAQIHLEARNEAWTVDVQATWGGEGVPWEVKIFSKYFNGIFPMSANPQSRIYEGHAGFEGGSSGTASITAPSRYTSVIVLTTFYPYQPTGFWLNQQSQIGTVTRYLEESPMYASEFAPTSSHDNTLASLILTPGGDQFSSPPDGGLVTNGLAAAAVYRGVPNANDLAVLQWRWGS